MNVYRGDAGAVRQIVKEEGIKELFTFRDANKNARRVKVVVPYTTNADVAQRAVDKIKAHFGDRVLEAQLHAWLPYYMSWNTGGLRAIVVRLKQQPGFEAARAQRAARVFARHMQRLQLTQNGA